MILDIETSYILDLDSLSLIPNSSIHSLSFLQWVYKLDIIYNILKYR